MRFFLILLVLPLLTACDTDALSDSGSGEVMLYWSAPMERVNGEYMDPSEIGGYEIRYRPQSGGAFTVVRVTADSSQFLLTDLPDNPRNLQFQVAVYDSNGIYSDYVTAEDS